MALPLDPRSDHFVREALPRGLLYVPQSLEVAEEGAWLKAITALPFEPAPDRQCAVMSLWHTQNSFPIIHLDALGDAGLGSALRCSIATA